MFYLLKNILFLVHRMSVDYQLPSRVVSVYRREFGDTFGSTLSVMCNSLDASLVRGWCASVFSFEPTAS